MFTKLDKEEKLALAGILKWVVSADHNDSLAGINEFFKENKWGDFDKIYNEMEQSFNELDDLKDFLKTIINPEAQITIIKIAKDIMISDVLVTKEEKDILAFLDDIWKL